MLEKRPTIWPSFILAVVETFAITIAVCNFGFWTLFAYYYRYFGAFLLLVAIFVYIRQNEEFAKNLRDIGRPDVKIAQAHEGISRNVSHMTPSQMAHHLSIVNALQLPFHLDPEGGISLLDGTEIKVSSLLKYIEDSKEQPDGTIRMKAERDADPEDRAAIRAIADEMGNDKTYSISAPGGSRPVTARKDQIMKYVEAILTKNELKQVTE